MNDGSRNGQAETLRKYDQESDREYADRLRGMLEHELARTFGFNHRTWYLHTAPRNQPCCVDRMYEIGVRALDLLDKEYGRINIAKSAIGSSP